MNNIESKQLEQNQLEKLAAQREVYSLAKRWHYGQMFATLLIPLALSVIAIIDKEFAPYAAAIGLGIFIIDLTWLEPTIKKLKVKGGKIQESFDCYVLELPGSPMRTVEEPQIEEVLRYHDAHVKIKTNAEKIRDWYPGKEIKNLPLHIARIICQRANCRWDSNQRIRYARILQYLGWGILALIIGFAVIKGLTLVETVLLTAGLVPFFRYCIKQCTDNKAASRKLDEMVKYSEKIWVQALNNPLDVDRATADARRLQDEIFDNRTQAPLVFDWFYKRFRDKDENVMLKSSEKLVAEAEAYLATRPTN